MQLRCILLMFITRLFESESKGFGPWRQNYGYVEVRPGAHMFWWLYYTTSSDEKPLILWFSGGPGTASSSYGNFESIGPYDGMNYQLRNVSWMEDFNLLFVDNPVGSGYSYVEDISLLPRSLEQNAHDIIKLLKGFYEVEPQFKNTSLYLFSNSFGSKHTFALAEEFIKEFGRNKTQRILKGIVLSNPWIYPILYFSAYGDHLLNLGFVDKDGYKIIEEEYEKLRQLYEKHGPCRETSNITYFFTLAVEDSLGIDSENIRSKMIRKSMRTPYLNNRFFMDGIVKFNLGINSSLKFGSYEDDIWDFSFDHERSAPDLEKIEDLLNNTNIKICIINGNDDLVTSSLGQQKWIDIMNWKGVEEYRKAKRLPLWVNDELHGYYKQSSKFSYTWLNYAGHNSIRDNPKGSREAVRAMIGL